MTDTIFTDKSDSFLYSAFQNDLVGHVIEKNDSSLAYANPKMFRFFNLAPRAVDGMAFGNAFKCIHTMSGAACGMSENCINCQLKNSLFRVQYYNEKIDGLYIQYTYMNQNKAETKWFKLHGNNFYINKRKYAVLSLVDETDYQKRVSHLEELLKLDLATGLKNKYSLLDSITEALTNLGQDKQFIISMIDFDNFKEINDGYGHIMGDRVLNEFSNIILKNISVEDIVGRYGGEEFIILFNNIPLQKAICILQKTHEELKYAFDGVIDQPVTFSAGAMLVDDAFTNLYQSTDLINKVDKLLYRAKKNGRNRIITTHDELILI